MNREPFATVDDLEQYWRPLTESERGRAEMLLSIASDKLRMLALQKGFDLDTFITDPDNDLYKTTLQYTVLDATKRAMQAPADLPPVDSYSQTAGPYSENIKYTNPTGDLFFKKSELSALMLSGQNISAISGTRRRIYD